MKYEIRILMEQIHKAISWCNEQFDGCYCYDLGTFYFDHKEDAVAFKLKFDEATKFLMIDPPSGWKYGFPRPLDKKVDQPLEEWLVENGYPQELIDKGMTRHCRYFESDV